MGSGEAADGGVDSNVVEKEEQVSVIIRCWNSSKVTVKVSLESTVRSFKDVVAEKCDVAPDQQRLIYKGRILKDDETLLSYGLGNEHTVHLVRAFSSSASPDTAGSDPAVPNTTSGNTTGLSSSGSEPGGGFGLGDSLFNDLGINGLSGPARLLGPDFDLFQNHLAHNPAVIREMMNSPIVQSIMNNPEILRDYVMNSPQLRELVDRIPELAHVLNDPSILRQTLEVARNPELMREMMRNNDRAMSNIEATPEGFNMLRHMYENVQEPLMNATTMTENAGGDSADSLAALLGTQGERRAADGLTNTSNNSSVTTSASPAPNAIPLPNPWTSADTGRTQTNIIRSNPAGEARSQAPAALGGLGLPGLEGMLGAVPDTNMLNQRMNDPVVSQIVQSMLSSPEYMNQMLNSSPLLRSTIDSNPQLREMIQNPEFLSQLTSPESVQQMMALHQSVLSQMGRQDSSQGQGQTGGGTGTLDNISLEALTNVFGGLGTGSLGAPNQPNVPPEELYATQLSQLQEMGFFDTQENIHALVATAGNVHAAVERLLGNSGQ